MNTRNACSKGTRTVAADPVDQILEALDLTWSVLKAPVKFTPGLGRTGEAVDVDGYAVLFRSDTKQKLAIVPPSHQVWQPARSSTLV